MRTSLGHGSRAVLQWLTGELENDLVSGRLLRREDYRMPADELARRVLGCALVRAEEDGSRTSGVIVETEAYMGVKDRACHSFGGRRTARVEPMYASAGTAYVYFTYGMHHCFNVVAGEVDEPVAVLIRAIEPREGFETMRSRRGGAVDRLLCSGPARLCQALDIDRRHSGIDLAASGGGRGGGGGELWLEQGEPPGRVVRGPRVGIDSAGEPWVSRRLRFWVEGSLHVSR